MALVESGTPSPTIPVTWTDDPLVVDKTFIKKTHITEMRAALEALDGHIHVFDGNDSGAELDDVSVTWAVADAAIIVDKTEPLAAHFNEIITYLKAFDNHRHYVVAYSANSSYYNPGFTFEDDPVVADVTWIEQDANEELRTHLESMAAHTHEVCCECECTCTCTCTCHCDCTCTCTCRCEPEM